MQVTLDLPEKFALDFSSTELGQRIKLDAALTMFQSGSLSAGAACEFAGVDRFIFIAECKKHNIPMIDYDSGELAAEITALQRSL